MEMLNIEEDTPINQPMVSGAIERAQKRVEMYHFDIRKSVLKFDDVLTEQRELIYTQRRRVLEGKNLRESMLHMLEQEVARWVDSQISPDLDPKDWPEESLPELVAEVHMRIPQVAEKITLEALQGRTYTQIESLIQAEAKWAYEQMESHLSELGRRLQAEYGVTLEGIEAADTEEDNHPMRRVERDILLKMIDSRWIDHLHGLDSLREGIGLRAYGQKDPLIEYKREAYDMFQQLTYDIQRETITLLFRSRIEIQLEHQLEEKQHATELA
jgi:preprotein translocase subunit SecA